MMCDGFPDSKGSICLMEINPVLIVLGIIVLAFGVWLVRKLKPAGESDSKIMRSETVGGLIVFVILSTFGLGLGLIAYGFGWGQRF